MGIAPAALALLLAFVLGCSGDEPDEATATPPPSVTAAVFVAPTPGITAADLPQLSWELLPGAPQGPLEYTSGEPYVLDFETGRFYHLRDQAPPATRVPGDDRSVEKSVAVLGWSDHHGFLVFAHIYHGPLGQEMGALYATKPGGPLRAVLNPTVGLHVVSSLIHGKFVAVTVQSAFGNGPTETRVLDPVTLGERYRMPGLRPVAASADGSYLAAENSDQDAGFVLALDNLGFRVIRQLEIVSSIYATWSNGGHRIAYMEYDAAAENYRTVVLDVDSGTETELLPEAVYPEWSPDDRFILARYWVNELDPETRSDRLRVFESSTGEAVLDVAGAWPIGWVDEDIFAFTGNVCATFDAFTVDANGRNVRQLTSSPQVPWSHLLSPDRSKLVHMAQGGPPPSMGLLDLAGGSPRDYDIGVLSLYVSPVWSSDGRYVAMYPPPGKDGPCYGQFNKPQYTEIEVLR
jgi:hypothetical protein